MRVSQNSIIRASISHLNEAYGRLAQVQEQLASLKRINRPSDDPMGMMRATKLRATISRTEQYLQNHDQAQATLDFSSSVLQTVSESLARTQEIALAGASAGLDQSGRDALALELDHIIDTFLQRANTRYGSGPLFAGTAIRGEPFEAQRVGEEIVAVEYKGNRGRMEYDIGPNTRVQANLPGNEIFEKSGVSMFACLIEIRDLLRNKAGQSQTDQMQALSDQLEELGTVHQNVLEASSSMGARSRFLETSRGQLEDALLTTTELLSQTEDVDVSEAAVKLSVYQNSLQAIIAATAQIVQPSLLNFLE